MHMLCLDVEGVLLPELWPMMADATGIDFFHRTTQDHPDFHTLMQRRVALLRLARVPLSQLVDIAQKTEPLPGAVDFLHRQRERMQVSLVSDSFYELLMPLMGKLDHPALYCHHLETDADGLLTGWQPRVDFHKRHTVLSMRANGFRVLAAGDSYNDLAMLDAANRGWLVNAPYWIRNEHPGQPAVADLAGLDAAITEALRAWYSQKTEESINELG